MKKIKATVRKYRKLSHARKAKKKKTTTTTANSIKKLYDLTFSSFPNHHYCKSVRKIKIGTDSSYKRFRFLSCNYKFPPN